MQTYTIRHGSIAAVQHVTRPDGSVVYVTDSKEPDRDKDALPPPVLAAINRQFGIIFALPYAQRQGFIDAPPFLLPWRSKHEPRRSCYRWRVLPHHPANFGRGHLTLLRALRAERNIVQTGYLSFSCGAYRVIVQGMPICKDGPRADAMRAAESLRVKLKPEAWNGDRGEWVHADTIED